MSAYMMQDEDHLTIANYVMRSGYIPFDTVYTAANTLKRVNLESVNYRYKEKTRFAKIKPSVKPYDVDFQAFERLVSCWDYQCCEDSKNLDYIVWMLALSGVLSDMKAKQIE